MEEKEKKKQIARISIFITSVFVIFLSITYAFISMTLQGTKKQVITAGNISLELQEDVNNITISDALPMYDEVGMIQEPFTFRLVNNSSSSVDYVLKLVDTTVGDKLSTSDVKYYLTKDGAGSSALLSKLTDGQVDSGTLVGNQTIEYTLRLWIDSSVTENSTISGKSLSYQIAVEALQTIERGSALSELIIQADTEFVPDFSMISSATNGRGLYKLPASVPTETGEDIYYYRGTVDNNHVLFAGFCWEIVRTTETGGIKMIYDGTPVGGACSNTGTASRIGTSAFNNSNNSLAYNGYMYGTVYSCALKSGSNLASSYVYGNDVEWDGSNYILKDTITATGNWRNDYKSVGNAHHYTCFTTGDSCSSVYYVYYTNISTSYYITLSSGKTIEEALSEMTITSSNTTNSTIKTTIDDWYKTNIDNLGYTEYLEDTVWCNDRSVQDGQYGGWIKDGNGTTTALQYSAYSRLVSNKRPSLVCSNQNDKFTVESSNGNGALTYPVGLLTADEVALAGGVVSANNNNYYLSKIQNYWLFSPIGFSSISANEFYIRTNGNLSVLEVDNTYQVRPVVSLRAGVKFTSGDGTSTRPYVVKEIS